MTAFLNLIAATAQDTGRIAAELALLCRAGDCITLRGELGSGKTTFARGFIRTLAGEGEEIVSPTFTLVQCYDAVIESQPVQLWHGDFYRFKRAEEMAELGLDEVFEQAITLIEWPEIAEARLPLRRLDITIRSGPQGQRILAFSGHESWKERLREWKGRK